MQSKIYILLSNVSIKRCSSFGNPSSVWPDLAKFLHFGKILQVFGNILKVYFLFGEILNLLWQICCITGQIFIVTNGQILKYNLTIWSHCQSSSGGEFQPVPFAFKSNYEWYLQKNYTNILLFKSKNMWCQASELRLPCRHDTPVQIR